MFVLLLLLNTQFAFSQSRLLVIAPYEFISALYPLVSFKDCSMRPTTLVTLDEIYNNLKYSTSRDNPEKIKRAIADYYQSGGFRVVLLVGDCDKFPVRYCKAYNTEWGSPYLPSDLYYADLFKSNGSFDNWDGDGDNIIGEMDYAGGTDATKVNLDNIDTKPDVALARIPASSEAEVNTYVNKVIRYEISAPGNWFKKALLVVDGGSNPWGVETKMNGTVQYLSGFTVHKYYWDDNPYSGMNQAQRADALNSALNSGYGIVSYYGHGGRCNWTGWYYQAKMANLTNSNMLPVVFATACYTGRFIFDREYYMDVTGTEWNRLSSAKPKADYPEPRAVQPSQYDDYEHHPDTSIDERESLAEHFTVKQSGGAIGYVGCADPGEIGMWLNDPSKSIGIYPYFIESYHDGTRTLGGMWKEAMTQFAEDVSNIGQHFYAWIHLHKMNLFGDPSLQVGGAYTKTLSGNVYNTSGGPLKGYQRYKITGDVSVPVGQTLSADSSVSILFQSGKKITALDNNLTKGFRLKVMSGMTDYLISVVQNPQSQYVVRGIKVNASGQLRLRNGGEIKIY